MVGRSKKYTAAALLGLFVIQMLVSCCVYFALEQNRKHQQAKMLSDKNQYRILRLTKKEFGDSFLPKENEIFWQETYFDINEISIENDIYYVKVLTDNKETVEKGIVSKNANKTSQKNSSSYQMGIVKCLPEKEIQYSFYNAPEIVSYYPRVMHRHTNPFYGISTQPPDIC